MSLLRIFLRKLTWHFFCVYNTNLHELAQILTFNIKLTIFAYWKAICNVFKQANFLNIDYLPLGGATQQIQCCKYMCYTNVCDYSLLNVNIGDLDSWWYNSLWLPHLQGNQALDDHLGQKQEDYLSGETGWCSGHPERNKSLCGVGFADVPQKLQVCNELLCLFITYNI